MFGLSRLFHRLVAVAREEASGLLSDPGTAQDSSDSFEEYSALSTLRTARISLVAAAFLEVLFAPSDLLTYTDDLPFAWQMVQVRLNFCALGLVGYYFLRHVEPRTSTWKVLLVAGGMNLYYFGHIGHLVGLETPYFYFSFYLPAVTMVCLFPLRERVLATVVLAATTLVGFYLPHSERLSYRYNVLIVGFLIFTCIVSVIAGDIRYRLEQASFRQRQQLRRYAREQEELNRTKDAFVATVSHELRTPLNAIIGLTDAALDEQTSPRLRQYLRTMSDSEQVLLRLVNDILDLAKVKSGKLELRPEPVSMPQLVQLAQEFFTVTCRKKGLFLETSVASDVPTVMLDSGRVQQIVLNLISNAVKFTDRGTIRVDVKADRSNAQQPVLVIAVADTGVGISADKHEEIFEEFTQVDPTTTRRHGGTGLGLPIVRRLTRLMGGDVTVTPNQPNGSIFTVRLALVAAPPTSSPAPLRKSPSRGLPALSATPADQKPRTTRPKILVADDVLENRMLLQVFLGKLDCDAVYAETGREAVERFQADTFDLAILDIEMPELDGYGAVREMRAWEQFHGRAPIPILALTAHGLDEHRELATEAGFTSHLSKPLRKAEFLALVQEMTGAERKALEQGAA